MFLKVFTSGNDKKTSELFKSKAGFTGKTLLVFQTKMRKKTKYETTEEILLDELESQVRVEGQFRIDFSLLIYKG